MVHAAAAVVSRGNGGSTASNVLVPTMHCTLLRTSVCFSVACVGGKVIDASAAFASTGYKVLVMDTGVERTHPDLNVVEFVDFVDEAGSADHNVDGHGHGTHVGGE